MVIVAGVVVAGDATRVGHVDGNMPATIDGSWSQAQTADAGDGDGSGMRIAVVGEGLATRDRDRGGAVSLGDGVGDQTGAWVVVVISGVVVAGDATRVGDIHGNMPATIDRSWSQAQTADAGDRDGSGMRVAVVGEGLATCDRDRGGAVSLVDD